MRIVIENRDVWESGYCFEGRVEAETDKAILFGAHIAPHSEPLWFPKSQIHLEEIDGVYHIYLPQWIKKSKKL